MDCGHSDIHDMLMGWELLFFLTDTHTSLISTGNIWNTISFVKPTYITFPTFRPGSTADISFHFKTYRDNCVFLESSDDHLRNFIRIEMNSELSRLLVWVILLTNRDFCRASSFLTFIFCDFSLLQPPITFCLYSWLVMASWMWHYTPLCHSTTMSGTSFRLRSMWNWHVSRLIISLGLWSASQVRRSSPWSSQILF